MWGLSAHPIKRNCTLGDAAQGLELQTGPGCSWTKRLRQRQWEASVA